MIDQQYLRIKGRVYKTAHDFSVAGGLYYRAQQTDSSSTETRDTAENYRHTAIPYQVALDDCETYLCVSERDDLMEDDLRHVLIFQWALAVITTHLDRKLIAWALLNP